MNARIAPLGTLAMAALRVGSQAAFFMCLPKLVTTDTAAALFFATSLQAMVCSPSSLGSQFRMIKITAARETPTGRDMSSYYTGFGLLLAATCIASLMQPNSSWSVWGMYCFLTANYFRVFGDSLAQGTGHYNWSQLAYVAFWTTKIVILLIAHLYGASASFAHLVVLEFILSAPWTAITLYHLAKWRIAPSARIPLHDDSVTTLANLSRTAWLEIDKIVLPGIVSPAFYVSYSLVSRVATGSLSLIMAHLASITPQIIRSNPNQLPWLAKRGRAPMSLALTSYAAGGPLLYALYGGLSPELWLVYALSALIIPGLFYSSIVLDYIFYNISPRSRLHLNVTGLSITLIGTLLVWKSQHLFYMPLALVLSFAATHIAATRLIEVHNES